MKSASAIAFDYAPSRWLTAAIVIVLVLAVFAVAASGIPWWLKFALMCAAGVYGAYELRAFLRARICHAVWYGAGHWRVVDAQGAEHLAELRRGLVRGNWIVLSIRRKDGQHITIILGPENSDAELRRRLRVRLARAREEIG